MIDKILADLKAQEIYPERHPVMYSPWQVREVLTRFLKQDHKEELRHLARCPVYHPPSCAICARIKEILG